MKDGTYQVPRLVCTPWRNDDPAAVKDSGVVTAESNQDQCHVGITERRQRHTSWRLSLAMRRAHSARSESPVPDRRLNRIGVDSVSQVCVRDHARYGL